MKMENVILGRVDDYVYKKVEEIVDESRDLGMKKSECIYAILKLFFGVNKPPKDFEKIRELTIKMRKGLL
jgi:hydrogenase maturation factor HypE